MTGPDDDDDAETVMGLPGGASLKQDVDDFVDTAVVHRGGASTKRDDDDAETVVGLPAGAALRRQQEMARAAAADAIGERSLRGFTAPPAAGRPALPLPPPRTPLPPAPDPSALARPRRPIPPPPDIPGGARPASVAPPAAMPSVAPIAAAPAPRSTAPAPRAETVAATDAIPPFVFKYLLVSGMLTALGLIALIYLML